MLLKEVTLSLLSPVPHFDTMEVEIVKEILKYEKEEEGGMTFCLFCISIITRRHNSSSSSNNDPNDIENE